MGGRTLFAALIAAAVLAAPASASAAERYLDPIFGDVAVTPDITYGSALNNRGEQQSLELDMYAPAGDVATDRPAVVFAHGGSFRNGVRNSGPIAAIAHGYARRGFVAFSIEYRLRPSGTPDSRSDQELITEAATGTSETIQQAQHDMQAAVRFVRANAAAYGVDPDAIAVAGESAGAITAWQAGVNPEDPGESNDLEVSSNAAAIVSLWGAVDPDHVEGDRPPVIDLHGGADRTVPLPFGTQGCALMTAFGNGCEHVIWPTDPHAPFARTEELLEITSDFLCREAVPGCQAPAPPAPVAVRP